MIYINGVAQVGDDFPRKVKYPLGERWVVPGWFADDYSNTAAVVGRLYYVPIFVSEPTTYIAIGLYVVVAAAGKLARLGIYSWNDGVPGALILDAGTLSVDAPTGAKSIAINQELQRGYYFTAFVCDGTPSVRTLDLSYGCTLPIAGWESSPIQPQKCHLGTDGRVGDVAGGLSDPAPAVDSDYEYEGIYVRLREN